MQNINEIARKIKTTRNTISQLKGVLSTLEAVAKKSRGDKRKEAIAQASGINETLAMLKHENDAAHEEMLKHFRPVIVKENMDAIGEAITFNGNWSEEVTNMFHAMTQHIEAGLHLNPQHRYHPNRIAFKIKIGMLDTTKEMDAVVCCDEFMNPQEVSCSIPGKGDWVKISRRTNFCNDAGNGRAATSFFEINYAMTSLSIDQGEAMGDVMTKLCRIAKMLNASNCIDAETLRTRFEKMVDDAAAI